MPFLFSALAIRAVGRTAGVVVQEVRSQFADGQIMAGTKQPDYGPVIDICTAASLRELTTPALLAVLTPVIIGFGIGWQALGGFLAAVILTGQLMANYLSNAGGAWDNAKKYIEDGHHGGKGSDAHKAAVIGDTVGDPFKDTAGPALNPLIKVMNLVSLLDAAGDHQPRDRRQRRAASASPASPALVLIAAIVYSSRKTEGIAVGADAGRTGGETSDGEQSMLTDGASLVLAARPDFLKPEWWFDKAGSAALPVVTAIIFAESGPAVRVLPPRRLAAVLHRLPDLVGGAGRRAVRRVRRAHPVAADRARLPRRRRRSSATRSATCSAARSVRRCSTGRTRGCSRQENVDKAHVFFERHGPKSIVLARFVPIVRTFTPIVAGVADMRYRTFVTYNVIGGLLWAVGVTTLGHFLGEIEFFRDNIEYAIVAIVAISLVPVAIELFRHRRHRAAPADGAAEAKPELADAPETATSERSQPVDHGGDGGVLAPEVVARPRPSDASPDHRRSPSSCSSSSGRTEGVAVAVDEQPRHGDVRQVLDAQPIGPARRVQRVGDRDDAAQLLRRRRGRRRRPRPSSRSARPSIDRRRRPLRRADRRELLAHGGHQHRRAVRRPAPCRAVREVGAHDVQPGSARHRGRRRRASTDRGRCRHRGRAAGGSLVHHRIV